MTTVQSRNEKKNFFAKKKNYQSNFASEERISLAKIQQTFVNSI
jgi:hypothetical protein